jgi:dCTP deaminase
MMILTGHEIHKQVKAGRIVIEDFTLEQLNPNSYNYRLGEYILELPDLVLDTREPPKTCKRRIPSQGLVLYPGKLYLGVTMEKIGSSFYVPSLFGRSTMGRLGLWLQVTADLGNLGSLLHWTLELKSVQPLRVYAGMQIGQVAFHLPWGECENFYAGRYQSHLQATASRFAMEADS